MNSSAPRSSSLARSSSPLVKAAPIAGSSWGMPASSAASTSANFFVESSYVFDLEHLLSYDWIGLGDLQSAAMSAPGLGRVKTKSNLVVALSGGGIFAFFALSVATSLKIPGAVIPRRVFTRPGSSSTFRASARNVRYASDRYQKW